MNITKYNNCYNLIKTKNPPGIKPTVQFEDKVYDKLRYDSQNESLVTIKSKYSKTLLKSKSKICSNVPCS